MNEKGAPRTVDAADAAPAVGSDAFFADVIARTPDLVCVWELDGTIRYVNDAALTVLDPRRSDPVGSSIVDHLHPDDLERALTLMIANAERPMAPHSTAPYRLMRGDGGVEWFDIAVVRAGDHMVTIGRRVRDHALLDHALERITAGAPLREVVEVLPAFDGWRYPSERCTVRCADERGVEIVVGSDLPDLLTGGNRSAGTPWDRSFDDPAVVVRDPATLPPRVRALAAEHGLDGCRVVAVPDPRGHPPALVTVWGTPAGPPIEIHTYPLATIARLLTLVLGWTQQSVALELAARTDALTGLPNRNAFFAAFEPVGDPVTVLYLDLDRFKPVNDRHGHAVGDEVLRVAASRIRGSLRPGDLVARIGGDEFAVRCAGGLGAAATATLGARLVAALSEPIVLRGAPASGVVVGVSVGVAHDPDGTRSADELLEAADAALYLAKAAGGGAVQVAG